MNCSPQRPPLPTIRWIGRTAGGEIGECWRWTRDRCRFVEADADLTVLACQRPLVETRTAQDLVQSAAGKPLVQLLGVWCEGEGRTGKVVEGAQRVFWHAWPMWWRSQFAKHSSNSPTRPLPRRVRIDTPDAELAKALGAALHEEGIDSLRSSNAGHCSVDAIVWDGAQLSGREADRLATVTARNAGVPVVVLLDFPRPETVRAAHAIGAFAVLGKPFDSDALIKVLSLASHSFFRHSYALPERRESGDGFRRHRCRAA